MITLLVTRPWARRQVAALLVEREPAYLAFAIVAGGEKRAAKFRGGEVTPQNEDCLVDAQLLDLLYSICSI